MRDFYQEKRRQTLLKSLAEEERTIVIYESPFRIEKTLRDIEQFIGVREVVIIREITKIYEEIMREDSLFVWLHE